MLKHSTKSNNSLFAYSSLFLSKIYLFNDFEFFSSGRKNFLILCKVSWNITSQIVISSLQNLMTLFLQNFNLSVYSLKKNQSDNKEY
ncbi:hypothetical protein EGI24_20655 [Lacihabitans sp. CS3-21]|nr:hypothetical protein [Lacihabitans sp. CS3-21]